MKQLTITKFRGLNNLGRAKKPETFFFSVVYGKDKNTVVDIVVDLFHVIKQPARSSPRAQESP